MEDLSQIAKGLETIMTGGQRMFAYFEDGTKLAVFSEAENAIVGHWQYLEAVEDVVFVPVKR